MLFSSHSVKNNIKLKNERIHVNIDKIVWWNKVNKIKNVSNNEIDAE